MVEMKMIVGLGNPGTQYRGTRHNAGFQVLDRLAERLSAEIGKTRFGGLFGESLWGQTRLLLLKPGQYMNRSGQVVATAAGYYRLNLSDLLVVVDDLALEPGQIRLRAQGSAGGQKGLADIIQKLGSDRFARLRVGIGDNGRIPAEQYVLARPAADEKEPLEQAERDAVDAVLCWIEEGAEAAMNRYNTRKREADSPRENETGSKDNP